VDLYEALGVRRSARIGEIRRAYQRLARQLHPALNPGDPEAAERYRVVTGAYEVLSDPESRARYDRGEPLRTVEPAPPAVGFEGFDFSVQLKRTRAGFKEIFDGLLPGGGARRQAEPGEHLEQHTRLSFEESLTGARRRVQLVRYDRCVACGGSGETTAAPASCGRCQGTGKLRAARGHMVFTRTCPDCGGAGRLQRPCPRCEGEGRLIQGEWLDVEIPAGVGEGSRVRLPGCGNAGRRGGPAGDFVLVIEVEPHPVFRREGEDLFCQVPVTLVEAALGAHIRVPTPEGEMTIEIPAGTQTGQRFRLRKRGVPRPEGTGRGDLYVEARVVVPAVTDAPARALLVELARLHPEDPRAALLERSREKE
jgi:molecular chaperone DnaJ